MDFETLRAVTILRDLTDAELEAFADLLAIREVKSGERILEEGTIVNQLYIVCDGVVHVRRMAQTKEMLLGRFGVGAFFGEINLFDPGTATASIYAMKTPTRLATVSYESLRDFMGSNPLTGYKIVSAMMAEVCQRLRQTSSRLVNSVYWSSNEAAATLKKER
ncbi:MAG: cyclic nucleotide-binding domain-containing protein [Chthoniobacteraceae bacterium]